MSELRITPLLVGINRTDQGIMTYLRGYGQRIWLPIYSFLIQGNDRNILVDTGLEEFMLPPDANHGMKVLEFEKALEEYGLTPEDIDVVIQTHLHNDHCENTYKCKNAKVIVQKKEYDFARNPHPLDHRYFDDIIEELDPVLIDGDVEYEHGLHLWLTPGHTPGGMSVAVDTAEGRAVITGFCCNAENFPKTGPAITCGVHTDALAAYDSAQRVKSEADIVLPCHDPKLAWITI